MNKYIVNGGRPLYGEVTVSGAKNAAVAIIPADHNVHGSAHGHHVQIDVGPLQMTVLGPGVDVAALHGHLRAHGGKALDMLVDGPRAEVTAAGHGDLRPAESAEQSADEVI